MILKCEGGPMDGAVYVLSKQTSDPQERSTNRKPDGFWFDAMPDGQGRLVQDHYRFDRNADGGNHLTLIYRYDGQVVDTGVEFEVSENPSGDVTCGNRPTMPDEVAEHIQLTPRNPNCETDCGDGTTIYDDRPRHGVAR